MQRLPTWDEYYLEIAKAVAQRSDPGVESAGVVLVSAGLHRLVAAGFERDDEHAELDALRTSPTSHLFAGTAYGTRRPCDTCYTALADAGVFLVVWPDGASYTAAYGSAVAPTSARPTGTR